MELITVAAGDTVYSLARRYGVSESALIADNGLPEDGALLVGQSLIIRAPETVERVREATDIETLARRFNVTPNALFRGNYYLHGNTTVPAGSEVVITYRDKPTYPATVGGYAYDFIGDTRLDTVLPYLTYLMPFTYGFTADGTLVPPSDDRLLRRAMVYGVTPLMHLSTLTAGGYFDNALPGALFSDTAAVDRLYDNILANVRAKGYGGIDVDFEYLPAAVRDDYTAFIAGLTARMNESGRICVVALPPKTSDDQPGLLYEGIDYRSLGRAANLAFLMTYEWGYKYGPPLAVAPIPSVGRVVNYAVSVIPRNKLLLGIGNYGYDWRLPYVRGETVADTLSTAAALERARRYGAEILYDEEAGSPYYYYTDERGDEHVVWFEDARATAAKCELLKEEDLHGAFIWELTRENPQLYVTMNAMLRIRQTDE